MKTNKRIITAIALLTLFLVGSELHKLKICA